MYMTSETSPTTAITCIDAYAYDAIVFDMYTVKITCISCTVLPDKINQSMKYKQLTDKCKYTVRRGRMYPRDLPFIVSSVVLTVIETCKHNKN